MISEGSPDRSQPSSPPQEIAAIGDRTGLDPQGREGRGRVSLAAADVIADDCGSMGTFSDLSPCNSPARASIFNQVPQDTEHQERLDDQEGVHQDRETQDPPNDAPQPEAMATDGPEAPGNAGPGGQLILCRHDIEAQERLRQADEVHTQDHFNEQIFREVLVASQKDAAPQDSVGPDREPLDQEGIHLAEVNRDHASSKKELSKGLRFIMPHVEFTPAGNVMCFYDGCNTPMKGSADRVKEHFRNHHRITLSLNGFKKQATDAIRVAQVEHDINWYRENDAPPAMEPYCSGCSRFFVSKRNLNEHGANSNVKCSQAGASSRLAIKLCCGAYYECFERELDNGGGAQSPSGCNLSAPGSVPSNPYQGEVSSFRPESESMPSAALADVAATAKICETLVQPREDPAKWVSVLWELLHQESDWKSHITNLLPTVSVRGKSKQHTKQHTDAHLGRLLAAGDHFLHNVGKNCIQIAAGNTRSAAQNFTVQHDDQPTGKEKIFNGRKQHGKSVGPLLQSLLTFLYTHHNCRLENILVYMEEHHDPVKIAKAGVIPSILYDFSIEKCPSGGLTPLLQFALLRCFKTKNSNRDDLKLRTAGCSSSMFAELVYLVRLGAVAKSVMRESDESSKEGDPKGVVTAVNQSFLVQHICPKMSMLRHADSNKPKIQRAFVDGESNLIVDGVEFKSIHYRQLIPNWQNMMEGKLDQVFGGEMPFITIMSLPL